MIRSLNSFKVLSREYVFSLKKHFFDFGNSLLMSAPLTKSGTVFARASTATVPDYAGVLQTALSGELRIANARRVENLTANSVWSGAAAPTTLPSDWSWGFTQLPFVVNADNSVSFSVTAARTLWRSYSTIVTVGDVVFFSLDVLESEGLSLLSMMTIIGPSATMLENSMGDDYLSETNIPPGRHWFKFLFEGAGAVEFRLGAGCSSVSTGSCTLKNPMTELASEGQTEPSEFVASRFGSTDPNRFTRELTLEATALYTTGSGTLVDDGGGQYTMTDPGGGSSSSMRLTYDEEQLINNEYVKIQFEIVSITGTGHVDWCDRYGDNIVGSNSFNSTGLKTFISRRDTYSATYRFLDITSLDNSEIVVKNIKVFIDPYHGVGVDGVKYFDTYPPWYPVSGGEFTDDGTYQLFSDELAENPQTGSSWIAINESSGNTVVFDATGVTIDSDGGSAVGVRYAFNSLSGATYKATFTVSGAVGAGLKLFDAAGEIQGSLSNGTHEIIFSRAVTSLLDFYRHGGVSGGRVSNFTLKELRYSGTGEHFFSDYPTTLAVAGEKLPGPIGYLSEPAATNLATYSEDMTQGVSIAAGTGVAPVKAGDTVTVDLGGNAGDVSTNRSEVKIEVPGTSDATEYTFTFWLKAARSVDERKIILVRDPAYIYHSVQLGQVGEWIKKSVTATTTLTAVECNVGLRGNGHGCDNDEVKFHVKAQAELGNSATSYIPTTGATATRLPDTLTWTHGIEGFDTEGTAIAHFISHRVSPSGINTHLVASSDSFDLLYLQSSGIITNYDGTNINYPSGDLRDGEIHRVASSWGPAGTIVSFDGDSNVGPFVGNTLGDSSTVRIGHPAFSGIITKVELN